MVDRDTTRRPDEASTHLVANEAPAELRTGRERCGYCGATLDARLYFCSACATPYQSVNAVVTPATPLPLSEGELIQRKAPHAKALFWTYFTTVILGAVFGELLFREDRPDLRLMLQITGVFLVTCVFSAMFWTSLRVQLKQPGFFKPAAYAGLAILGPMLLCNFLYTRFLMRFSELEQALPLAELREAGLTEATLISLFCIYPAVTEEIAFRGLLQHWLQAAILPIRAVVLSSFLFAVMHFSIVSFPYLFGLGILLGWTKWKTGSLYPSMLIHFLHNFVVIEFF